MPPHSLARSLAHQAAEDREQWQQSMLQPLVDGSAMAQLEIVTGSDAVKSLQVDDAPAQTELAIALLCAVTESTQTLQN